MIDKTSPSLPLGSGSRPPADADFAVPGARRGEDWGEGASWRMMAGGKVQRAMIGELLRYWTTIAPERVRNFGYLSRLIALEFRAKRCHDAWAEHLRRCRAMIVKTADLVAKKDICVVVGSGLLLEVPLEALAMRFGRVYLVDIFHMPAVRRAAAAYPNVTFLTGDVTGFFASMRDGSPPSPTMDPPPARIPHLQEADLAISCNCLTQLAGPFIKHFEKTGNFTDLDADRLSYQVMERHVKAIANDTKGIGLLITDIERLVIAGDTVMEKEDLLKSLKLPDTPHQLHNEQWEWRIAPLGEEYALQSVEHVVEAKVYERPGQGAALAPAEEIAEAATGKFEDVVDRA